MGLGGVEKKRVGKRRGEGGHINALKFRPLLTAVKWRILLAIPLFALSGVGWGGVWGWGHKKLVIVHTSREYLGIEPTKVPIIS